MHPRNKITIQGEQNVLIELTLCDYFDINWDTILQANENNVNKSLQIFLTNINELLDKYMPLRKVSKSEYKRRFKPWLTDMILAKINKKNKAFKKHIKCKDPATKEQLIIQLKTMKNEITTLTRQSKKDYYNHYFSTNTNNLKKIWKGIKEIISIKYANTFKLEKSQRM